MLGRVSRRRLAAACLLSFAAAPLLWTQFTGTETKNVVLPATLAFRLMNHHIVLDASVDGRSGLSFMLDTGNKFAVIDLARAREMGVTLGAAVKAQGTSGSVEAYGVTRGSMSLDGLAGFAQPLRLALPLRHLAPRLGGHLDGLIGSDFIEAFVVEIDYVGRTLTLHDRDDFRYTGPGRAVPLRFAAGGHPLIAGTIQAQGAEPIDVVMMLDLGSGSAIELNAPFVAAARLIEASRTVTAQGVAGAAGESRGRIGRLATLTVGPYRFDRPLAFLSQDQAGTNRTSNIDGRIGNRIAERFRVFLDYRRKQIILEPNDRFRQPLDQATSGLVITAGGADFKTFEIAGVLEGSPGAAAGFRQGDVLLTIDEQATSEMTLSDLLTFFERAGTYRVRVRRADTELELRIATTALM